VILKGNLSIHSSNPAFHYQSAALTVLTFFHHRLNAKAIHTVFYADLFVVLVVTFCMGDSPHVSTPVTFLFLSSTAEFQNEYII